MFLCTHRHSKPYHLSCSPADAGTFLGVGWGNNVLVPVHTQAQQTLLSFLLSSRHRHLSGGWGWGGVTTFMFLCTHRHSKPYHLSCCPADTGTFLGMGWAGVGWGNNVHVPVHTQAQQTLLSFLLSSRHRHLSGDGVGWGNNVHVPVHTANLIIFLALQQTQAQLFHDQLLVGWGNNGHDPVHTQAQQTLLSFLLSSKHRHLSGDGVG